MGSPTVCWSMVKTWPLLLMLVAGCGAFESEQAQQVARTANGAVADGVDEAKKQLRRIDTDKVRGAWDTVVQTVAEVNETPPAPPVDPLAGADEAISCDAAHEYCTVTAEFAARARAHGPAVAKQVRIRPVSTPVQGMRIDGITAGSITELVGLRKGDVVTHVNGSAVGSMAQTMGLYMQVRSARQFVVHYRRGDQERAVQLDVV